ncbi:MAG: hypothetical protein HC910_13050 [Spirulinaceae cyanobacterium SM2_1_0]|nr:hypothetical protein [Spirulinaceae cyanobacterium SM2_1_0]
MQQRWRDGLWVGGLALGVSAIALLLLPNARRVALLLGLSAGATAGTTLIRVRAITTHPASPGLNINGQPAIAAPREQSPLSTVLPAPDPEPTTDAASDLFQSTLNQSERVLAWLVQRGIRVKSYYQTEPGDRVFAELALLLGEKYDNAVPFYEQIKRHLSSGHSFQVNLAQKSQQEIADTTQLGHRLSAYALLASYRYDRRTKTIYAAPPSSGQAINFFSGGWFERFTLLKVATLLTANQLDFQCLLNPKVTLPNQDPFELDLLFLLPDDQPLWIECKTGDYQAYITKYAEIRQVLGLESQQAFLLILDLPDVLTRDLSQLYGLTVTNQGTFLSQIARQLALTAAPAQPLRATPPLTEAQAQLRTLLNRLEMRPLPEYRQAVLEQLIEIFCQLDAPKNLIELKLLLAGRTQNWLSKTKLQDILNVLMRRGCFLNAAGEVVNARKEPIVRLSAPTVAALEQCCIEGYAYAAIAQDRHYFDDAANVATFAAVVGSPAPKPAAIATLQACLDQDTRTRQSDPADR